MPKVSPEKWDQLLALLDGLSLSQWQTLNHFVTRQFDVELGKTQLPEPATLKERLDWHLKFT